jgi:RNA polymerase sigma-70 factor (ECF subfamily)
LLGRIQSGERDAWHDFSQRCNEVVLNWCRWNHVQGADAEDLVQNSMVVVLQKIGGFRHNGRGSFRAWLKAIAWRCWCDAIVRSDQARLRHLRKQFQSASDDIEALETEYERLREMDIMAQAMTLVQQRVRPSTWMAFCRTALENRSGVDVAAELNLPVYSVHSARMRVQQLLAAEVRRIQRLQSEP